MLGEGPFYPRDPNLASTWPEILPVVQKYDHVEVIDEYITINKAISAKYDVPYVDIKVGYDTCAYQTNLKSLPHFPLQSHVPWFNMCLCCLCLCFDRHYSKRLSLGIASSTRDGSRPMENIPMRGNIHHASGGRQSFLSLAITP